jgi:hypothetical protein
MAVLRDGQKILAKLYLSPDHSVLRIVLPELSTAANPSQVKIDMTHQLIDFRRMP